MKKLFGIWYQKQKKNDPQIRRHFFVLGLMAVVVLNVRSVNAETTMATAPTQQSCESSQMDLLRLAAINYDAKTPEIAKSLLVCPAFHDEALVWVSIYQSGAGLHEQMDPYLLQVQNSNDTTEHMQVLSEASRGQYQKLQNLIETGVSGWKNDAEAHLVLARALVRHHQYLQGDKYYHRYLELKPDDVEIQIEAGFAIVGEDWRKSKVHFDGAAKKGDLDDQQKLRLKKGEELLQRFRFPPASEYIMSEKEPAIPLMIEEFNDTNQGFLRRSLQSGFYQSQYELDASQIDLSSDDVETRQVAHELSAYKVFKFPSLDSQIRSRLGWFQGSKKGTVAAEVSWIYSLANGWTPSLGFQNEPWAKYVPLNPEKSHWVQQSSFLGINYFDYLSYRWSHHRVTEQSPIRQHTLMLRYPIWNSERNSHRIHLQLWGEQIEADKYSAYVYSPKKAVTWLPGLRWSGWYGNRNSWEIGVDYGTIESTLNLDDVGVGPTYAAGADGKILATNLAWTHEFHRRWIFKTSVQKSRVTDKDDNEVYMASQWAFGLIWYFEE